MQNSIRLAGASLVLAAAGAMTAYECPTNPPPPFFPPGIDQIGNPAYCPDVPDPAFPYMQGPHVLFDEGHHNWGTITPRLRSPSAGTYHPLAELLRADGFVVDPHYGPFTPDSLAGYDILIVVHPLPEEYVTWNTTLGHYSFNDGAFSGDPAFTPEEIATIQQWVYAGGSLLINAEHIPFTGSALPLTSAFGMHLVEDALGAFPPGDTFDIASPTHPIFQGRNDSERITSVPYVTGGTRIHSDVATPLFRYPRFSVGMDITAAGYIASFEYDLCIETWPDPIIPDDACQEYRETQWAETTFFGAGGDVPARVREYGAGRVALFTEFSTFSNQLLHSGDGLAEYGGLVAGPDDSTQLVLNTFRWLAFVL